MTHHTVEFAGIPEGDRIAWDVLRRYLDATASEDERRAVGEFFVRYPRAQALLASYVQEAGATISVDEREVGVAWDALQRRCGVDEADWEQLRNGQNFETRNLVDVDSAVGKWLRKIQPPTQSGLWGRRALGSQTLRRYAIAGVGIAIFGIVSVIMGWWPHSSFTGRQVAGQSYTTGEGQRAKITLSDGSTVTLNVASQLDVPVDYAMGNHTLRLRGEAFFTIVHHTTTPFTVIAGTTPVRVLGTSFVVRRYTTDSFTLVAVQDGKVVIPGLVLTAAKEAVLSKDGVERVNAADPSRFSFTTGVLSLNAVPFPEAINDLDRWYGADIRLGDSSLVARHVTGEYAAGSLADLADILSRTFGVRVVRNGRTLTLHSR